MGKVGRGCKADGGMGEAHKGTPQGQLAALPELPQLLPLKYRPSFGPEARSGGGSVGRSGQAQIGGEGGGSALLNALHLHYVISMWFTVAVYT